MRQITFRKALLITLVLWAIAVASRFAYNGLIFGFDYGLFHPDGSLYAFKTLTLMGHSQDDAGIQVANWYAQHAYKLTFIDPKSLHFDVNPSWVIYGTRLSYPILSIPFVSLIGLYGLLAIPVLSYLVLMLGVVFLGKHFKNLEMAILVVFLMSVSLTVGRWMLINSTDSLLVALSSIFVYFMARNVGNYFWTPLAISLVVIGSFTRFSLFLWLGFSFIYLLSKNWYRAAVVSITAIGCFLPTLFLDFESAVLPNEGQTTLITKALKIPVSMARMAFYDVAELAVLDRILLALVVFTFVISLFKFKTTSARAFLVSLIMLWLTAGLNGTPGVNFRYELPILPVLAWVLVENLRIKTNLNSSDTQI